MLVTSICNGKISLSDASSNPGLLLNSYRQIGHVFIKGIIRYIKKKKKSIEVEVILDSKYVEIQNKLPTEIPIEYFKEILKSRCLIWVIDTHCIELNSTMLHDSSLNE